MVIVKIVIYFGIGMCMNILVINCDHCKHYNWYYDFCDKWNCEVDAKAVYDCFERNNKEIKGENE